MGHIENIIGLVESSYSIFSRVAVISNIPNARVFLLGTMSHVSGLGVLSSRGMDYAATTRIASARQASVSLLPWSLSAWLLAVSFQNPAYVTNHFTYIHTYIRT